jgi:hypothetical protein
MEKATENQNFLENSFIELFNINECSMKCSTEKIDEKFKEKLLLENNLIDPAIILTMKYSLAQVNLHSKQISYRIHLITEEKRKGTDLLNCMMHVFNFEESKNIILLFKNVEGNICRLYSSKISTSLGIEIKEDGLLSDGYEETLLTLKQLDLAIGESQIILEDWRKSFNLESYLQKFLYIIECPLNENIRNHLCKKNTYCQTELIVYPSFSKSEKNKNDFFQRIIQELINSDAQLFREYQNEFKLNLSNEIGSQTSLILQSDLYSSNYIFSRLIKRNVLLIISDLDNLSNYIKNSETFHKNFNNDKIPFENLLTYINIIDDLNNISIQNTINLLEISLKQNHFVQSNNESLIKAESYIPYLNDNKISKDVKLELCQKIIQELFHFYLKEPVSSIYFISSLYSLVHKANQSNEIGQMNFYFTEDVNSSFFQQLYHLPENNIYETFETFKEKKLNFMIKKSSYYETFYRKFEDMLFYNVCKLNQISEINYFHSSYLRYSTIINDILSIQSDVFSHITGKIQDNIDLDCTLIIYKKIIDSEYDEYLDRLNSFHEDFIERFGEFLQNELNQITNYFNSIVIYTEAKTAELIHKYKHLFVEMKLKVENYINEVIELDIKLIICIKQKLSEVGYLNDFISNYLANIQYDITLKEEQMESLMFEGNDILKQFIVNIGVSSTLGITSGLIGFGVSRALTMISADILTGSMAGPIGTIAGAAVGTISLLGTSMYQIIKNKQRMMDVNKEYYTHIFEFKKLVIKNILDFKTLNKNELDVRLQRLFSYVEYSIKKYACINS